MITRERTSASGGFARALDRSALLHRLTFAAVLAFGLSLYMALAYAGTDKFQGDVQRIFYIHFAAFYSAGLAFVTAAVGGLLYLRSRRPGWDVLALACIEVGFALASIMLLTGMIWARPVWNTWWTWDPRLTSAAIMMLTYAAYLMLRNGIENPDQRRRFASVYGILALGTVVFTVVIIRIRPDTMYAALIAPGAASTAKTAFVMSDRMTVALIVNVAVWCGLIAPVLIWWRIRLENLLERVSARKAAYFDR